MVSTSLEKALRDRQIPNFSSEAQRLNLLLKVIHQLDLWLMELQLVAQLENTMSWLEYECVSREEACIRRLRCGKQLCLRLELRLFSEKSNIRDEGQKSDSYFVSLVPRPQGLGFLDPISFLLLEIQTSLLQLVPPPLLAGSVLV